MIHRIWVGSGSGESLKTDKLEETESKSTFAGTLTHQKVEIVVVTTWMRCPCSPLPFSNSIRLIFFKHSDVLMSGNCQLSERHLGRFWYSDILYC